MTSSYFHACSESFSSTAKEQVICFMDQDGVLYRSKWFFFQPSVLSKATPDGHVIHIKLQTTNPQTPAIPSERSTQGPARLPPAKSLKNPSAAHPHPLNQPHTNQLTAPSLAHPSTFNPNNKTPALYHVHLNSTSIKQTSASLGMHPSAWCSWFITFDCNSFIVIERSLVRFWERRYFLLI